MEHLPENLLRLWTWVVGNVRVWSAERIIKTLPNTDSAGLNN